MPTLILLDNKDISLYQTQQQLSYEGELSAE